MSRRAVPPTLVSAVVERSRETMRELLIARLHGPPYEGRWTFPSGPLEAGEPPEEAVRRVLRGLEGLEAQIVFGQPPFDHVWDDVMCRWRFYFCQATCDKIRHHDFAELRWVNKPSLREYEFDPVSQQVVDWLLEAQD